MNSAHSPKENSVDTALVLSLQQQLIETQRELLKAQKQIISLQKKLDKKVPKNPKDKDVFWHLVSDGLLSNETAKSGDLVTLKQFYDWLVKFAKKHIRPYVNPKVYGECLNQMTRGLGERISALETQEELGSRNNGHTSKAKITRIQ
jgi:hypothetical protein